MAAGAEKQGSAGIEEPIIVVGTGRSGTSLIAHILVELDVFMGYTFIPRNHTNKHGHWEDVEFITLNREFVSKNCNSEQWLEQMQPLIERRRAMGVRWGWKCPITANLLHYFTKMLPKALYLVVTRKRNDVVKSCMSAYNWTDSQAERLYDYRTGMINRYLSPESGLNILRVRFEDLIGEPHAVISQICFWAGIEHKLKADEIIDRKEVHFGAKESAGGMC